MKRSYNPLRGHQDVQHIFYIGFRRMLGLDTSLSSSLVASILRGSMQPFSIALQLVPSQIFLYRRLLSLLFPPKLF
jgi:hypothetical protein